MLTRVLPALEVLPRMTDEEQSWVIAQQFGICAGWRLNFAVNQAGEAFGQDGTSGGVSNGLDRLVMGKLRSQSDLIVTSGATARAERYKSSKHARIAIITRTGDLDSVPAVQGSQFFTPLIITNAENFDSVEKALNDVDVEVVSYGEATSMLDPLKIVELVAGSGYQSPILESGASLSREFIHAGVVKEVCLTISKTAKEAFSARSVSPSMLRALFGSDANFGLVDMLVTNENIFTRWIRVPSTEENSGR
jgi:riboflavin biosynthesis pyrimidine reductase